MHYYTFNIGSYHSHTSHLSEMEDLAYRRMLDWVYLHESPLPDSVEQIARLIRMRTHTDCIANVLQDFFDLSEYGYMQKGAQKQIDKFRAKSDKAKQAADARWSKGRKKPDANALQTQSEGNANQEPITNNQEPITTTIEKTNLETPKRSGVPVTKIVDLYHEKLPSLPQIVKLTDARRSKIKQRWREDLSSIEAWSEYFDYVSESSFLMGKQPPSNGRARPFIADLEWLTTASNIAKIVEGKYHG